MAGKVNRVENTPETGGQLNRCWGDVASDLAQLDTSSTGLNGGAMGLHSMDNNTPQETFRDVFNGPRLGIGNGTAQEEGPHAAAPGDGGLGEHAINNGTTTTDGVTFLGGLGFSVVINPINAGAPDPTQELICESAP
jgi:hypothetical protein